MKLWLKKQMKSIMLMVYYGMTYVLPVRKNSIVFMSNLGRSRGGNPGCIYEKMLAMGLDRKFHCCFLMEQPEKIPGRAKAVKIFRFRFYYRMATAGIWVSDTRFPNYIRKRKGVTYIQTWHGTPLKKLGLDMQHCSMAGKQSIKEYHEEFRKNAQTWDYLVVQNEFSAKIFPRAFDFYKTLLPTGYPRNDLLFDTHANQIAEQVKSKLQIGKDKKVILYAPTWRDNQYYDKASYKMDAPLDYAALYEALKEDYVIVIKYHYMVREKRDFNEYQGFYKVVGQEIEISELYLAADLLITDYSSVMFDYSLLKRPMIFYVYDLEEYKEELRGFYFDFCKEAPGPLVTDTQQLIETINKSDFTAYETKYSDFIKKYHTYEKGTASLQIVKLINTMN